MTITFIDTENQTQIASGVIDLANFAQCEHTEWIGFNLGPNSTLELGISCTVEKPQVTLTLPVISEKSSEFDVREELERKEHKYKQTIRLLDNSIRHLE